jgi:hypothetical protein
MSADKSATSATSETTTAPANQIPAGGRKRRIFRTILLIVAAIVVVFVGVVAVQPPDFRISRSTTIDAPPSALFAQVNDFHNWEAWSPWAKLDPAAKNSFEGASAGTGAIFKWSGNDQIGEGKMTVTESRPDELVRIKLEFVRPFEDTSTAEFTFQPEGNGTVVTWSMYGRKKFINKAICLFMDMDKMLGGEFEKGLAQMKTVAETAAGK